MSDTVIYTTPIVNKDYKGKRIDKFLSDCFADISRSQIQRLIALGNVTCDEVNGSVEAGGRVVCDEIRNNMI